MIDYFAFFNVLVIALKYKIAYHESNPDVGFGPSKEMLLKQILDDAGVILSGQEIKDILSKVNGT